MLEKPSVYNVLTEGMYFRKNVAHRVPTFWTFHWLPEVIQIHHMIFETKAQIWYKFCTML